MTMLRFHRLVLALLASIVLKIPCEGYSIIPQRFPAARCIRQNSLAAKDSIHINSKCLPLFSSFTSSSSSSKSSGSSSSSSPRQKPRKKKTVEIAFEKVVHPPAGMSSDMEFLGSLVAYLQDHVQLPAKLPMVYETRTSTRDEEMSSTSHAIVTWSSPLSPDHIATSLAVEIVAIYPQVSEKKPAADSKEGDVATMALVVVEKEAGAKQAFGRLPPVLQGLFADSERQIIQALDRALNEFTYQGPTPKKQKQSAKPPTADWMGELLDEEQDFLAANRAAQSGGETQVDESTTSEKHKNVVDAEVISKNNQRISSASPSFVSKKSGDSAKKLDFAVQAAQKVARKRKEEGFAVAAARRAAAQKQTLQDKTNDPAIKQPMEDRETPKESQNYNIDDKDKEEISRQEDPFQSLDIANMRPASLLPENMGKRSFHQSLESSNLPKVGVIKREEMAQAIQNVKSQFGTKNRKKKPDPHSKTKEFGAKSKAMSSDVSLKNSNTPNATTKRNHADSVDDLSLQSTASVSKLERKSEGSNQVATEKDETDIEAVLNDPNVQEKAIKSIADALEEMQSPDMSPEQLLNDVMTFGDAREKEERTGDGFATGAFEKAKELLREQKRQRDDKARSAAAAAASVQTTKVVESSQSIPRPRTAEEELKQMFEAGERMADGKIALSEQTETSDMKTKGSSAISQASTSSTSEQDADALIARNRDISNYARVLEDELVELEVKLNKSPGEELDGPRKNPHFDIFSGPEVYNPNVDPETAVNWPGALPDTKQLRLPKELEETVTQAKFAADVLSKMKEESSGDGSTHYFVGGKEISLEKVEKLRKVMKDAVSLGLIRDPLLLMAERSRLQMLVDELWNQPEERIRDVTMNYKDLLLSDNFVELVRERMSDMIERDIESLRQKESDIEDDALEKRHSREREILAQLVVHAQLLLKEARALGAELEAQQLEVIRSICKVAMDPRHETEEETAEALTDAVRDMRPLFDDAFVAYLKYAVAEEEGRLARSGVLDDPEHNQWLFVLKIVQNGVYTELARGIQRYIDHILYVLRMETPVERRKLLNKLVDAMPTLDVRPFVAVVDNIAGALGESTRGEFAEVAALGEMTNSILQLHRDVHELLPPERIALKARDADEWAARKKQQLLDQRKDTQKRLEAGRKTQEYDEMIDGMERQGEMERFD